MDRRAQGSGDRTTAKRRLGWTMALVGGILLVEIAGGVAANSLALLSDAAHVFTDFLSLGLAFFAVTMCGRPASARVTFGYYRLEILAALVNGVLLALIALGLFYEAVERFSDPPEIDGPLVVAVALLGLAGNVAGLRILRAAPGGNLNVRGAALHVLSDALSSGAVVVSGIAITLTGWYVLDPILSLLLGIVIVVGAVRILKESVDVLLEATPANVDLDAVEAGIRAVQGVREVHDLHIWSITSGMPALSGHVVLSTTTLHHSDEVLNAIKDLLRERHGIEHTTIQVESEAYREVGEVHGAGRGAD